MSRLAFYPFDLDATRDATPAVGRDVEVIRGPRVRTVGRVTWYGPDQFRRGHRVQITTLRGERFFLSDTDVRVTP